MFCFNKIIVIFLPLQFTRRTFFISLRITIYDTFVSWLARFFGVCLLRSLVCFTHSYARCNDSNVNTALPSVCIV